MALHAKNERFRCNVCFFFHGNLKIINMLVCSIFFLCDRRQEEVTKRWYNARNLIFDWGFVRHLGFGIQQTHIVTTDPKCMQLNIDWAHLWDFYFIALS
jgi:hypothetical protein